MKNLPFILGCSFAILRPAVADELDDRLQAFRAAAQPLVEQARTEVAKQENAQKSQAANYALNRVSRILAPVGPLQPEQVRLFLAEMTDKAALPAELQALLTSLADDLPKLITQRNERLLADIDRFVKETAAACLSAKTEGELDPTARKASEMLNEFRDPARGDERIQRANRRLQATLQVISRWQDYLAFLALGDAAGGDRILQQLSEKTDYPIIARAEIEKRLTPSETKASATSKALAILREVRSIDELATAIEKARAILSSDRDVQQKSQLHHFDRLVTAHTSLQAGFIGEAFQIVKSTGSDGSTLSAGWQGELARLRGLALLIVVPRYLVLPEKAAPNQNEAASDFLLRLAGELVASRRFAELIRVLETYRSVAFNNSGQGPSWIQTDIDALQSFVAAERLAAVGSWVEAIKGFRRAAASVGKFAPATEAATRLGDLIKDHPDDAKAAERLAELELQYQRLSRDIANDAARAMESRMPPDIRSRMSR